MKIKLLEQGYQESLKESSKLENKDECDVDERIPLSKDLTMIIEKIANSKGSYENNCDEPQVALQKIPNSSVAVFQNIEMSKETPVDDMRVQVCYLMHRSHIVISNRSVNIFLKIIICPVGTVCSNSYGCNRSSGFDSYLL